MDGVQFVFLDEAQDIDQLRFDVIARLSAGRRLMITGDPRQCIYRGLFGADPGLMRMFRPDARICHMTVTFRCSPEIVDFVNAAFPYAGLPPMRSHNTTPARRKRAMPSLIELHAGRAGFGINRLDVVNMLVDIIRQRLERGAAPQDIAILTPSCKNSTLALLNCVRTKLEKHKVPVDFNKRELNGFTSAALHGAVYIGSVHSFKGSERAHIILSSFYTGIGAWVPTSMRGTETVPDPDFKNVMYVAATRAITSLTMIESCHYPQKNERVSFLVGPIVDSTYVVKTSEKHPLGKFESKIPLPKTAVKELLQDLPVALMQELAMVAEKAVLVEADIPQAQYSVPIRFIEYSDSDLYGLFMEVVIARELVRGTPHFAIVANTMLFMPVYVTKQELANAVNGIVEDSFTQKFAHSRMEAFDVMQYLSHKKDAFLRGPEAAAAHLAMTCNVHVLADWECAEFYKNLQEGWAQLTSIADERIETSAIVVQIFNNVLYQNYHSTRLGVYWLPHHVLTAEQLLPTLPYGARHTWRAYLADVVRAYMAQIGSTPEKYQERVSEAPLNGCVDAIDGLGRVIDFKCCGSDGIATGVVYCGQVQAYRKIVGNKDDAFLFSALTLKAYRVPWVASSDSQILDILQKAASF
jgi:hypothetical protein